MGWWKRITLKGAIKAIVDYIISRVSSGKGRIPPNLSR